MTASISILMAIASAVLTHISVRFFVKKKRAFIFLLALVCLSIGFYMGDALGGFWPGVYTLISVYFLTTMITPWIHFYFSQKNDR